MCMKPIVICGPTASGKTELALFLARRLGGEIISADSRQTYKHLTAGTAKPAGQWQAGCYRVEEIPYHLVDFLEPQEIFNAGAFVQTARQLWLENPQTPFIFAGGTGMWLQAYFVGMDNLPPSTPQTRQRLEDLLARQGKEGVHRVLETLDPQSAAQIPAGNIQRTMRAVELCWLTGKKASQVRSGKFHALPDPQKAAFVYLNWDKTALDERIRLRTQAIFEPMCREAQALLAQGVSPEAPALKSLGYPQALAYLEGRLNAQEAQEQIRLLTRQYAKRQRTWFNRYTNALRLDLQTVPDFNLPELAEKICRFAGI